MAEQQKPKIDLKSRLQKMGPSTGSAPPPPAGSSVPPAGAPPVTRSVVPPTIPGASVPPPSGVPAPGRPAPVLDPRNPLSAVAQGSFRAPPAAASSPMMVQPQRIEVDEGAVHQARSGARKQGLVIGLVLAVGAGAVCWVGGSASQQGAARAQGVHDAHDLAADLTKAKETLDQLDKKLQAGARSITAERKFPEAMGQELSAVNVDFGGDKLFGRRFSGVPADTTRNLFDFITRVTALNDRKTLVVALLSKLQKPITEELKRPPGQLPLQYVLVVDKDAPAMGGFLAPLAAPIGPESGVPNELLFVNPRGSGNVKLPRLTGEKIPKEGAAITVVPNTFEKVCPSTQHGQIAQLVSSINSLIGEIEGQRAAEGGDVITETKAGLGDVALKLADALNKVN
jgi:hypothetical protein